MLRYSIPLLILTCSVFIIAGTVSTAQTRTDGQSLPLSRSDRLHGTWRLHSSHANDLKDRWELIINSDGTAKFSGIVPYIEEVAAPSDGRPPRFPATKLNAAFRSLNGKWDLSTDHLSIVTPKPSIHRWHVLAITTETLVLKHDFGGGSGQLFWVRAAPK